MIFELTHPYVAEQKQSLVITGYGGVFMVDEVKISAGTNP